MGQIVSTLTVYETVTTLVLSNQILNQICHPNTDVCQISETQELKSIKYDFQEIPVNHGQEDHRGMFCSQL